MNYLFISVYTKANIHRYRHEWFFFSVIHFFMYAKPKKERNLRSPINIWNSSGWFIYWFYMQCDTHWPESHSNSFRFWHFICLMKSGKLARRQQANVMNEMLSGNWISQKMGGKKGKFSNKLTYFFLSGSDIFMLFRIGMNSVSALESLVDTLFDSRQQQENQQQQYKRINSNLFGRPSTLVTSNSKNV